MGSRRASEDVCQKRKRLGQPPNRFIREIPVPAFVTARRRNDCFGPTAFLLRRVRKATFAKAGCRSMILGPMISRSRILHQKSATAAVVSDPCPAPSLACSEEQQSKSRREEAAMPGQPVRARARFRNVPQRFTLENRRLPLTLPQSFSRHKNSRFR
jgi:hypothetical protein